MVKSFSLLCKDFRFVIWFIMSSIGHGKVLWVNNMTTLGDYLLRSINRDICEIRTKRVEDAIRIMHERNFPNSPTGVNIPEFLDKKEEIIKKTAKDLIFSATCRNDYWTLQDNAIKVKLDIPL